MGCLRASEARLRAFSMSEKTSTRRRGCSPRGATPDWNLPEVYAFFSRSDRAARRDRLDRPKAGPAQRRPRSTARTPLGWKSSRAASYEASATEAEEALLARSRTASHYVGARRAHRRRFRGAPGRIREHRLEYAICRDDGFEAATAASARQLHADIPGNSPSNTNRATLRGGSRVRGAALSPGSRCAASVCRIRSSAAPFLRASMRAAASSRYSPSQGLKRHARIPRRGHVSRREIRVITELVGGSFGIRSYSYAEHVA